MLSSMQKKTVIIKFGKNCVFVTKPRVKIISYTSLVHITWTKMKRLNVDISIY